MTPCQNQGTLKPQRRAPSTAQVEVPQDRRPFSCPLLMPHCPISLSSDSKQLRLVDGGGPCAGRVEIFDQGSWGTICGNGWDLDDARVVCRQMGCGDALNAMGSAHFGAGSGPIWLDTLDCTGKESHVWQCPFKGWGLHNCSHEKDAGVVCSGMVSVFPCGGRMKSSVEAGVWSLQQLDIDGLERTETDPSSLNAQNFCGWGASFTFLLYVSAISSPVIAPYIVD